MEKTERGLLQGLSKFMRCSQLSQERRQRGGGVSRDCPIFCEPLLAQERLKLWTSNLAGTFAGSIWARPLKILETRGRGRSQGLSKIFTAAIYRAHRAVDFAIAQLSCTVKALPSSYLFVWTFLLRSLLNRVAIKFCPSLTGKLRYVVFSVYRK